MPTIGFSSSSWWPRNAEHQPVYRSYLAEIAAPCLPHLEAIFANATSSEEQTAAANAIADFAQDDQPRIARLLTIATAKQYEILFPLIAAAPDDAVKARLAEQAARLPADDMSSVDRVPYGQQRAGAAITLLHLGERESVLRVFDMTDDPEAMTQFIHRCRDRGVRPEELLELLKLVSTNPPSPPRVTPHSKQVTIGGEGRGEGETDRGRPPAPSPRPSPPMEHRLVCLPANRGGAGASTAPATRYFWLSANTHWTKSLPPTASNSFQILPTGTRTIRVRGSTALQAGSCGSGESKRWSSRWTRHRSPIRPIASGSR